MNHRVLAISRTGTAGSTATVSRGNNNQVSVSVLSLATLTNETLKKAMDGYTVVAVMLFDQITKVELQEKASLAAVLTSDRKLSFLDV